MKIVFPAERRITTPDLVLRPLVSSDAPAYFALYSDVEVMRTYGVPAHQSIEETQRLIAAREEGFQQGISIHWAICLGAGGSLIGDIGYWRFVKERFRGEIGAKLVKAHWSGGLMTQALAAVIYFGLEKMGLHSAEGIVDPTNRGAMKLCEKVGFVQEGLIREHTYVEGKFVDTALFSAIQGKWESPVEICC